MEKSPLVIDRAFVCPSCGHHVDISTADQPWTIKSPRDMADRLTLQMADLDREVMDVLVLNTKNRVMEQSRVYVGNVSQSLIRVGELLRPALVRGAAGIILVHNHPSGDPTPSPDDLHVTAEALAGARLLDIDLLDHIVVARDGFVSLRDRGVKFTR